MGNLWFDQINDDMVRRGDEGMKELYRITNVQHLSKLDIKCPECGENFVYIPNGNFKNHCPRCTNIFFEGKIIQMDLIIYDTKEKEE